MAHLFVIEHDCGAMSETTLEGLTAARGVAESAGDALEAIIIGELGHSLASELAPYGVAKVHLVSHEILTDYAPSAWGDAIAQLAVISMASAVSATGTERGNEVMAHVASLLDMALVSNCIEIDSSGDASSSSDPAHHSWEMTRVRWGGSLHERAALESPIKLVTHNPHSTEPAAAPSPGAATPEPFEPELDDAHTATRIVDRVVTEEGITLATAPVVVSGGRGVGSAEAFAPLEELAELIGGAVGCSRVVTNNGWKNHKFQVGQTGTVIAPELYIACGISGAIQHWVGMMAAKNVLAINIDKDAPMVTKGDYAVIADLHEVVPAITAEIQRRKGMAREDV